LAELPIYHRGRKVGILREDRVYVTQRGIEHIFKRFDGLGLSDDVLWQLKKFGCRRIIFLLTRTINKETFTERYVTTPGRFELLGTPWFDGHDSQKVLSFEQMENHSLEEVIH
jgi:hypothetical protein